MPYGPPKARLTKAINILKRHPELQQFGQSHDDAAWNGMTACTHVICQCLEAIWNRNIISINDVNRIAQMPYRPRSYNARLGEYQPRGMNNIELNRFLEARRIPYKIVWGVSMTDLLSYSNRGPVFYGMRYGSAPEWRDFVYNGIRADGRPNGYARPARHAGKTQLAGFTGRHAVLLLGYRAMYDTRGNFVRRDAWRKEPNHNSPSRPENPPFDIITVSQASREYRDFRDVLGGTLYAAVPTRYLPL